ncbi:unnamed protein product [Amoebophrya sp. A25]|nr:unnamed protein product [Amoebophrya sp. A25]|eukprot:GSA25T00003309001.1
MAQSFGGRPAAAGDQHLKSGMFDELGNYNFSQREIREYHHDFAYLGGGLGADELEEKAKKKKLVGKIDFSVKLPPKDAGLRGRIEAFAVKCAKQEDPDFCEHNFFTRDPKTYFWLREDDGSSRKYEVDKRTGRILKEDSWKKKAGGNAGASSSSSSSSTQTPFEKEQETAARDYYQFVKHCCQRSVDFIPLVAKQQLVEADRIAKLSGLTDAAAPPPDKNQAPKGLKDGTAGQDDPDDPVKKFLPGSRVEVLGLKAKPELNGEFAVVKHHIPASGRFQIEFEKYKIEIAVKPANLMFAENQSKTAAEEDADAKWTHDIPKNARVMVQGLTSDAGKLLNGQKGEVVSYDDEKKRYNVKLDSQPSAVKKVKEENLKCVLPPGWEEHYDEHMGKYFYRNTATQRIQWKHPVLKARVGGAAKEKEMRERMERGETMDFDVENENLDFDRRRYACDDLNEGEGGFNLKDLVAKVSREEDRKRRREAGEEVDSDAEEDAAELAWKKEHGLVERARKRSKKERQQLFKHSSLLDNVKQAKKIIYDEAGVSTYQPVHVYDSKQDAQSVLEARLDMLKSCIERIKGEIVAANGGVNPNTGNPAGEGDDDEDEDEKIIVSKEKVPSQLWRDCAVGMVNAIDVVKREFEDARQKHMVQTLNLTLLSLLDDEDGLIKLTAEQLADKMDSLLGLLKCML